MNSKDMNLSLRHKFEKRKEKKRKYKRKRNIKKGDECVWAETLGIWPI
jgi:hypothetical protein